MSDDQATKLSLLREKMASIGVEIPSDAAADVLMGAMISIRNTERDWVAKMLVGEPSINDYADDMIGTMRARYGRR